jgi:hypothetical protein
MTDLPLTGGCLCGAVRYEVTEPLVSASYCHCTRCQRRTGTGSSAQARTADGSFRIVAGAELVREWVPPGNGFAKCFCMECGSALYSRHPETGVTSVRLGTFDRDPGIRPQWRQFVADAAPWEPVPDDGLPRYDEGRPAT